MAGKRDYSFLGVKSIEIKYKPRELATRGIAADKLKRGKATIGIYHPRRSVGQTALIHNAIAAELTPSDNPEAENILYEGLDDEKDASPRNFDRAFRIGEGAVYQKGSVYVLFPDKGDPRVIEPPKDMVPLNATLPDYINVEKVKREYEEFL